MKITLTKWCCLSGYGRSRSGLVVKKNAEGALPCAPSCLDIPLTGATYQQTKAECLVHVNEAELPYAMNISHHSIYSIAWPPLSSSIAGIPVGNWWGCSELVLSFGKDTASSFVSFSHLLSWSDRPENRRYENAQNPICMLILKWSIPGIVVTIIAAIIVGKNTLGFQCEWSHRDPRLGASLWTHRPSDSEEAGLDGTKV